MIDRRAAAALLAAVFALGCQSDKKAPSPPADPARAAAENAGAARQLFATRCAPCHGAQGAGDGPAAAGLVPRPRNFAEAAWQDSVTDAHLEKVIIYGGLAGGKSPGMPPNLDLEGKEGLVAALRVLVRDFRK